MSGVLTGLIPACHTPFNRAGHLDLSAVPRQADLFRESGIKSVFVAGTTGEWSSLTRDERMALCDRWTEVAGDELKVAVHVGHNCQAEAVALASHARESGRTPSRPSLPATSSRRPSRTWSSSWLRSPPPPPPCPSTIMRSPG